MEAGSVGTASERVDADWSGTGGLGIEGFGIEGFGIEGLGVEMPGAAWFAIDQSGRSRSRSARICQEACWRSRPIERNASAAASRRSVAARTPERSKRSRRRVNGPSRATASTMRWASSCSSPRTMRMPRRIAGCEGTSKCANAAFPSPASPAQEAAGWRACSGDGAQSGSGRDAVRSRCGSCSETLRPRPWSLWKADARDRASRESPGSRAESGVHSRWFLQSPCAAASPSAACIAPAEEEEPHRPRRDRSSSIRSRCVASMRTVPDGGTCPPPCDAIHDAACEGRFGTHADGSDQDGGSMRGVRACGVRAFGDGACGDGACAVLLAAPTAA